VLQTENLTPLQNLAVVSRSPDITEAIVLSRIIGPSLGQLQSRQLGEEAMTRQTSLPLFLSQSLAMCEALQLGAGRVVRLTATICIENHLLARRELTTMLCNCSQVVCSRSAISRISRLASGISADELVARYASSKTCATHCHWSPIA